jgi:Ring finger domain
MNTNVQSIDTLRGTLTIPNCGESYKINVNLGMIYVQGVGNHVQIHDNLGSVVINGLSNKISITGQNSGQINDCGMSNQISTPRRHQGGNNTGNRNGRNGQGQQQPQLNQGGLQNLNANLTSIRMGMVNPVGLNSQMQQTISINYGGSGAPNIRMTTHQSGPNQHAQTISIQNHRGELIGFSEEAEWEDEDDFDDEFDSDDDEDEDDDEDYLQDEEEEEEREHELNCFQAVSVKRNTKSIPDNCVICMEPFNRNQPQASYLECHHWFHKDCISRWLESKPSCPQCKYQTNVLFVNDGV